MSDIRGQRSEVRAETGETGVKGCLFDESVPRKPELGNWGINERGSYLVSGCVIREMVFAGPS